MRPVKDVKEHQSSSIQRIHVLSGPERLSEAALSQETAGCPQRIWSRLRSGDHGQGVGVAGRKIGTILDHKTFPCRKLVECLRTPIRFLNLPQLHAVSYKTQRAKRYLKTCEQLYRLYMFFYSHTLTIIKCVHIHNNIYIYTQTFTHIITYIYIQNYIHIKYINIIPLRFLNCISI